MKPQNKFIQKWQEAKQEFGASELARTANLDLRTVNNAIKGNEIDPSTFEKINKAVIKLKLNSKKILKQLEG